MHYFIPRLGQKIETTKKNRQQRTVLENLMPSGSEKVTDGIIFSLK